MSEPDGDPSAHGARVFHGGRIVGHVDLRLNASAGLTSSEAHDLCKALAGAVGNHIERKRKGDSDA